MEARAGYASERSTFERLKQASATPGVVAGNELEIAQQKAEAANARVDASMKNLEAMRQAARAVRDIESYLQVTAPFDGVVTERSAHVGSLVGPNTGPLVRIQQVSPLRLVAAVPEVQTRQASIPPFDAPCAQNAALRSSLKSFVTTAGLSSSARTSGIARAPGDRQKIRTPQRRSSSTTTVAWRWARPFGASMLSSASLGGSMSICALNRLRHATEALLLAQTAVLIPRRIPRECGLRRSTP